MTDPDAPEPEPALPAMPQGMPDLGGLLDSFQRVQEARAQRYEGQSGGGAVKVAATGELAFESVTISPEVVAAGDVELLQDLELAALHDLTDRMAEAQSAAMGGLGDLDLGGLLGGAAPEADEG